MSQEIKKNRIKKLLNEAEKSLDKADKTVSRIEDAIELNKLDDDLENLEE